MKVNFLGKDRPVWLAVLAILALSTAGLLLNWELINHEFALIVSVVLVVLFARGDLRRLWNLPSALLLGYAAYTALSVFWAVSGKFFRVQFVKLLPAVVLFALLAMRGRPEQPFVRRVMAVIADVSAVFAAVGVEAASTGLCARLFNLLPNSTTKNMNFTAARLYGLFVNPNVEASLFAIGILFSLALLCSAETRRERNVRAAVLAINAFAFVLAFSMGAMVCFAVSIVVYLLAAGKGRGAALARMLEAAVPTVLLAFLASRFFNVSGALKALPVLLLLLDAAAVAALDKALSDRLTAALGAREKLLYGVVLGIIALAAVYIALALRLGAPYTFSAGGTLYRSIPLDAGGHVLQIDADGPVSVYITSRDSVEVLTDRATGLYDGDAGNARFTVPAGSEETRFTFAAGEGVTLRSATIDGKTRILLRYRLLPDFVAYRLQGTLTTNSSVAVRRMLWRDGLRYWKLSPVFGHGIGSFETGISLVQDFHYETRYPHNHYVQVLLEGGVVGFVLFFGAQAALAAALWRRRRAMREGRFAALYCGFAAAFVMNALQMFWDVSMTNLVFLCETYSFYALVVLTCAEPLGKRGAEDADAAAQTAKRRGKAAKPRIRPWVRAASLIVPVFVFLTMLGNYVAYRLYNDYPDTLEQYLDNLAFCAKIDVYDRNDAWLTYALQVAQAQMTERYAQADEYAERLVRLKSNSVHYFLLEYYCNTQQFERMLDMPLYSAIYAASDDDMWNSVIEVLRQVFIDRYADSPLIAQGGVLLPKLMAYYDAWQNRNAAALLPVALTEENEAFFDTVLLLNEYRDDPDTIAAILYTRAMH